MNKYKQLTNTVSAVTLAELKNHLYIFDTTQDDLLSALSLAATELAQTYTGEFFVDTLVESYYPTFGTYIELPHKHILSVTSIKYLAVDNTTKTVAVSNYYVDETGSTVVIRLNENGEFPSDVSAYRNNPIIVTYLAGFSDTKNEGIIPSDVKAAVLLYSADMYSNRENTTDRSVNSLPLTSEILLRRYRRVVI